MSYLKESEIKKVADYLGSFLSKKSRITRKELFHNMQEALKLHDDQEEHFTNDISHLINNNKFPGIMLVKGRYGGIRLGEKKNPEAQNEEPQESESSEASDLSEKAPIDVPAEVVKSSKDSLRVSNVKCDWSSPKAKTIVLISFGHKEYEINLPIHQVINLMKNVFATEDSGDDVSNVEIITKIVSSDETSVTVQKFFCPEAERNCLEKFVFYHLGGLINF